MDESQPHPTRLSVSLVRFNVVFGIYVSALAAKPVDLPFDPPDGLLGALRQRPAG